MSLSEGKTSAELALRAVLILVVLLLVSSYFLAMFLGPALLLSPEGATASSQHRLLPVLLFVVVGFYTPVALNVGLVFFFLWGVFALCFVAAWRSRENFHEIIRKGLPLGKLFNNYLFAMPIITSMMLVAVLGIHSFQEAHGVPTGDIPLPPNRFEALFELSYFALIEEIGFRVTPIGAFLVVYLSWVIRESAVDLSLGQRLKLFLTAPLHPERAKKMVGLKTVSAFGVRAAISTGEWVMIFFTSIIFGLAHYLPGGGWEIGKVTSASAVGLVMGLTYLLYGVQAPILLHWFFNSYNYVFIFASELHASVLITFVLVDSVTIVLGYLGWLAFMILGLLRMVRAVTENGRPRTSAPSLAS